jgi:hypothetical protein
MRLLSCFFMIFSQSVTDNTLHAAPPNVECGKDALSFGLFEQMVLRQRGSIAGRGRQCTTSAHNVATRREILSGREDLQVADSGTGWKIRRPAHTLPVQQAFNTVSTRAGIER